MARSNAPVRGLRLRRSCSVAVLLLASLAALTSAPARSIPPLAEPTAGADAPAAAVASTTLNLNSLEQRLADTHAIGLFTKLSLKNQVDDLLAEFKSYYSGGSGLSLAELRQRFELLLMKVVTLLQDDDPALAAAVSSSREAIWATLSQPKTFAEL